MLEKDIHIILNAMGIQSPTKAQIKATQRALKEVVITYRMKDSSLTTTHRSYLHWTLQGYTPERIAKVMGIKTSTVYEHRGDIKKRMNCNTMEQVIIKAFQLGYLNLSEDSEQQFNMIAIRLLEQNGLDKPTQEQIDKVEAALWQLHWSHEGTSKHANHFNSFTQNNIRSFQMGG